MHQGVVRSAIIDPEARDAGAFQLDAGAARDVAARRVGIPSLDPAPSTLKLYAGEWAGFVAWCRAHGRTPLPATAETLTAFLLEAAPTVGRGALGRRRAAIGAMHRRAGLPAPRLDAASRRALRAEAKPPSRGTTPSLASTPAHLVRVAAKCPRDSAGLRDRALLLLAAATIRPVQGDARAGRSGGNHVGGEREAPGTPAIARVILLALAAEDVRFTETGVALRVRFRTDDPQPTRLVTLARGSSAATCPVRALEDWLRHSDAVFGPVFRKVNRWGSIEHTPLGPDAWHGILARRSGAPRPRSASTG